jgi:hypothetical protein
MSAVVIFVFRCCPNSPGPDAVCCWPAAEVLLGIFRRLTSSPENDFSSSPQELDDFTEKRKDKKKKTYFSSWSSRIAKKSSVHDNKVYRLTFFFIQTFLFLNILPVHSY